MSGYVMMFPDTVEEFMEQNKVVDREQVYSNGVEFVPIFRMQQWFDHVKRSPDDVRTVGKTQRRNTMSEHNGLYPKYIVTKAATGEPVNSCFILRPDRDLAARIALRAYAEATENEALADDIFAWLNHLEVSDDAEVH